MNTQTKSNPLIGLCVPKYHHTFSSRQLTDLLFSCVTFGLLGAALLPMIILVNMTPEQTPTNIDTEQEQVPPDEKGGVIDVQRLGA